MELNSLLLTWIMRHDFCGNEDQPRQTPPVGVSVEGTFFAVSGAGCNAPMEALGSLTTGFHLQFYKLN